METYCRLALNLGTAILNPFFSKILCSLGLICVPSVVCLFREDKLLVGTTFLQEKKGKVYLEDCESRRQLFGLDRKDVGLAGCHSCVGL